MDRIDVLIFSWSIFLIVLGLILAASGFGILVVGRLDGIIIILIGAAMFWGGWILSRARGVPCAAAAVLNVFDAASSVSFWSFEINPFVLSIGPTMFMIAKIVSSLTIMLYAKFHPNPRRGGIALTTFYALVVGWNLSQHIMAYLSLKLLTQGILLGVIFSLLASMIVMYFLYRLNYINRTEMAC